MLGLRSRYVIPTMPCPRTDAHRSHFHGKGPRGAHAAALCEGIAHDCSTDGHVTVTLSDAIGCQRCGTEIPVRTIRADELRAGDYVLNPRTDTWWEVLSVVPLPSGAIGVRQVHVDTGARCTVRYLDCRTIVVQS